MSFANMYRVVVMPVFYLRFLISSKYQCFCQHTGVEFLDIGPSRSVRGAREHYTGRPFHTILFRIFITSQYLRLVRSGGDIAYNPTTQCFWNT